MLHPHFKSNFGHGRSNPAIQDPRFDKPVPPKMVTVAETLEAKPILTKIKTGTWKMLLGTCHDEPMRVLKSNIRVVCLFGTRVQLGPKRKNDAPKKIFSCPKSKEAHGHRHRQTDNQRTSSGERRPWALSPTLCQTTADDMVFVALLNLHESCQRQQRWHARLRLGLQTLWVDGDWHEMALVHMMVFSNFVIVWWIKGSSSKTILTGCCCCIGSALWQSLFGFGHILNLQMTTA
jgi:hypothetical protein